MSGTALQGDLAPGLAAPARRAWPVSPRSLLAVAAALALAAGGAALIVAPKGSATTDDAYVHADSTSVAPKVRGLIAEILVRDNQRVHKGDPLVRIDPEEFDARLAAATADLAGAQAGVQSARAALVSLEAEERLADAGMRRSQTVIGAADAQDVRAGADRRRYESLAATGAVSKTEADHARADAISARSETAHARAELAVATEQAAVVHARRPGLVAALALAQAAVLRAQAALDLARQDHGHTLIRAPIDGVVGDRQAQPGDYVQPGTRLLTLVPTDALYVTANFKETQIARMRAGQPALVWIDARSGPALHGHVESLAPGSGSAFALLPFEPGTGNFTKIVQRVPVRITLDAGQDGLTNLRPGLSAQVTVTLAERR
jgi:membrane fusion protein (multidrug efflux system)